MDLVVDGTGNYVIHHVLDFGESDVVSKLSNVFLDDLVNLCCHRFSSTAIEKCLSRNNQDARNEMIRVIA